jgi:hypothetical protein
MKTSQILEAFSDSCLIWLHERLQANTGISSPETISNEEERASALRSGEFRYVNPHFDSWPRNRLS